MVFGVETGREVGEEVKSE